MQLPLIEVGRNAGSTQELRSQTRSSSWGWFEQCNHDPGRANTHQHLCTGCRDQEQPMGRFDLQKVATCGDDARSWRWFISG